ncbi:MAG: serine/threonine protein kinase [Nannocystaceae bacterium]|nr:serine/threonine protein kinase [Nannocystaceae bacterium]
MAKSKPTSNELPTGEVRVQFGDAAAPVAGVERNRVFSALHAKMFGTSDAVTIGRFVVDRRIGSGAMGIVYAAYDPELDRRVALKLLREPDGGTLATARIEREARALAKLRHPNVVTVYEVGHHEGDRFIAMDLVDGETLREWLSTRRTYKQILEILIEAGHGLVAAHAAGLVHRDFKPDNVLVEQGHARVVDFGLARPDDNDGPAAGVLATLDGKEALPTSSKLFTATGAAVGTPAYMAPEAFIGESDARSDQFGFCVTLYEALYGVRPFDAESITALLEAVEHGTLQRPKAGCSAPSWVRRIVVRGLSTDPEDRWPDMLALLDALERFRRRSLVRRVAVAGIGGTLVGAVVMAVSTPEDSACRRSGERMEGVWNWGRKSAVKAAFADIDVPYAADAWRGAASTIDDYTEAWVVMRRSACEATFERGEQSEALFDARMQCLDRRLEEVDALLTAFETPDGEIIARSVAASLKLSLLDDCANEVLLRAQLNRADGPQLPVASDEMYAELAKATTKRRTGKYAKALVQAKDLAERADAGGYLELATRSYLLVAILEDRLADESAAEISAKTAMVRAELLGDEKAGALAQITLVSLLTQRHAINDAHDWIRLTRATLQRLGDPPALLATLVSREGVLLLEDGRYDDALVRQREALALRQGYMAAGSPLLATSHFRIGTTLSSLGRSEEALSETRLALEIRVSALGEHHPDVATAHSAVATALQDLGRMSEAVEEARLAIELSTHALGPWHTDVGRAHANLGIVLAQRSMDPTEGIPSFRKAVEIFEVAKGPRSLEVAYQLGNIGRVLMHVADKQAVPTLKRALSIYDEVLGPDHPDILLVLNSLVNYLGRSEEYDDALVFALRAVELGTKAFDGDHPSTAGAWTELGGLRRQRGEFEEATEALNNAVDMFTRLDSRPAAVAPPKTELARLYFEHGDIPEAIEQMEGVRAALQKDPMDHEEWLGKVQAWLDDPTSLP